MGVSDGSVRTREGRASHAWILQAPNGSEISGRGPVDGSDRARTSHRAELQGQTALFIMLAVIVQYFKVLGGKITTYCDNQSVVNKLQQGWRQWRYRHTKGADGDLQTLIRSALQELESGAQLVYKSEWVQSHQDDNKSIQGLPRPAALNVRMDQETKLAYDLPPQWQTQQCVPVFRSERCAVYIDNIKITSSIQMSVLERWKEGEAKEYLMRRHGINAESFQSIYWQAMRYALRKFSAHRRATAVKAIHRHLPTQDKLFQQNRVAMSSICPRCLSTAETNRHVYCCPNADALRQRKADWVDLWKQMHKCRTATIIEQTWRQFLSPILGIPQNESIVNTLSVHHDEVSSLLQQAIQEQSVIGWEKLLLGMGTRLWMVLQDTIDAANPKPPKRSACDWINSATHQFLKFSLRCWKARNNMVYGHTRQEQHEKALEQAREKITQLYQNPPELSHHYRSIFEVPLEHRLRMPLQAAEHWLSLMQHRLKVTSHNITMLLKQHQPMPSHLRTMRCLARQQAKDRMLPFTPTKARSRAVQEAVKVMRAKIYGKKAKHQRPHRSFRKERGRRQPRRLLTTTRGDIPLASRRPFSAPECTTPPRHHPP